MYILRGKDQKSTPSEKKYNWVFILGSYYNRFDFKLIYLFFPDQEHTIKHDSLPGDHDIGVDVDNDDDLPLGMDMDSMDHDPNDMGGRPRKIRR